MPPGKTKTELILVNEKRVYYRKVYRKIIGEKNIFLLESDLAIEAARDEVIKKYPDVEEVFVAVNGIEVSLLMMENF